MELICELENAKYVTLVLDRSTNEEGADEEIFCVTFIKENILKCYIS
jgi:hypothetical protein